MSAIRAVIRRVTRSKKADTDVQFIDDFCMPPPDLDSTPDFYNNPCDFGLDGFKPPFSSTHKPKKPTFMQLPTDVLENIISNFDTCTLHAFRQVSPAAAKLAEFRGIQCHKLIVDRYMRPGAIESIERKGKIITTASIDAVLNTERVKVRHMLQIGVIHPAEVTRIIKHIDSRFHSVVFEGPVYHKVFYALLALDLTITMEFKGGIKMPVLDTSRFWDYFPGQTVAEARKTFDYTHIFVKATYDPSTDAHVIRVVPARQ